MEKKIKLSEKQVEVIKLMRDGWEMVNREGVFQIAGYSFIRKKGVGDGFEVKKIKNATLFSIHRKHLASVSGNQKPYTYFSLTELGKTINIEF